MDVSAEEEIRQIAMQEPHLLILGAGASYAALPTGDKHGKKLPLMNNLIEVLGLEPIIESTGMGSNRRGAFLCHAVISLNQSAS